MADISIIKSKLSQNDKEGIKNALNSLDHDVTGVLPFDKFLSVIRANSNLIDHEIVTLARYYGGQREINRDEISQIVHAVQNTLKEMNYETFPRIILDCKLEDSRKSGFIDINTLANICTKHSLPLTPELFEQLIKCIDRNEQKKLDFQQFVMYLNWRDSPAKTIFSTRRSDIGSKAAGSGSWPQNENQDQFAYDVNYTRMLDEVY